MKLLTLFFFSLLTARVATAKTEVYFSPRGGCEEHVIEKIEGAKSTLQIAMYSLNNSQILEAIIGAENRGIKIWILLDRTQAFTNPEETLDLVDRGITVKLHSKNRIQHNKFAVVDGSGVITGSFNWTNSGELSNEENCLFIDDPGVVSSFQDQFRNHLWKVNTSEGSQKYMRRLRKK